MNIWEVFLLMNGQLWIRNTTELRTRVHQSKLEGMFTVLLAPDEPSCTETHSKINSMNVFGRP